MATIFKRPRSKFWYIKYYVNGEQVYRSLETTNERVARKLKEQIEADDVRGDLVAPSTTPLPEFLEDFCKFLTTIRTTKSCSADTSSLRVFFGPVCPSMELGTHVNARFREEDQERPVKDHFKRKHVAAKCLEDVTPEMIEAFIARRIREDKIAPKTANRLREILHRMFEYAIKNWHFVSRDRRFPNPVAAVERRPEPAPVITWLTQEQIDEQIGLVKDWPTMKAMVATYIYAGLRREEGTWLTPADVDLDKRLLYVRAKTIDGRFWQPKTKRNRVVPISLALAEILSRYAPKREGPWYFPSSRGLRWNPDNFSQELREINQEAALEWSCLDFRHTFGSHLAQNGTSLYKIAELMGNSPEICRRHYAALCPEKMHDVVEFQQPQPTPAGPDDRSSAVVRHLLEKIEQLENEKQAEVPRLRIAR